MGKIGKLKPTADESNLLICAVVALPMFACLLAGLPLTHLALLDVSLTPFSASRAVSVTSGLHGLSEPLCPAWYAWNAPTPVVAKSPLVLCSRHASPHLGGIMSECQVPEKEEQWSLWSSL